MATFIGSRKRILIQMVLLAAIGISAMEWFKANYVLGIDEQIVKCIPGVDYVIGDLNDRELVRGGVFIVESKGIEPLFDDGTLLVKFLMGFPGDTVKVSDDGVFVNGNKVAVAGLPNAEKLGREPKDFHGEKVLGDDEFWILGTTPESFDSRYWGSVGYEQIKARAYPFL
ncbi:S26 family signal peptidase [Marinobacter salicampi]|uniref:S26 family signal peptidase n=1 Tax=Marinobacter salicampi TaxID=435907 RepID=UPI00140CEC99|nr:S26 family signal peptidase [Marinobacter salicampi]